MSDDEARALGARWIAADGGWRDGMLAVDGVGEPVRCVDSWRGGGPGGAGHYTITGRAILAAGECKGRPGHWPDLRDPATRGAVLEVVRERWDDLRLHLRLDLNSAETRWVLWTPERWQRHDLPFIGGPSEAEALVAALEATPKP